jgi:hypothetical protein
VHFIGWTPSLLYPVALLMTLCQTSIASTNITNAVEDGIGLVSSAEWPVGGPCYGAAVIASSSKQEGANCPMTQAGQSAPF